MTSWSAPLLEATPGDNIIGGSIRSVPGVVWSCDASRMPNPEMHLWTATLATELGGLEPDPLVWTGNGPYREWFLMPTAMVAINSVIGLINSGTDVRSPWGTCRPRMASSRSNSKELDERPTHVEVMVGRFFAHHSESSSARGHASPQGADVSCLGPLRNGVSPCVGTCSTMADPRRNRVRSSSGPLLPSFDSDPSRCSLQMEPTTPSVPCWIMSSQHMRRGIPSRTMWAWSVG